MLNHDTLSPLGAVAELADAHDLGSCAERRGGSSPPGPTMKEPSACNCECHSNDVAHVAPCCCEHRRVISSDCPYCKEKQG